MPGHKRRIDEIQAIAGRMFRDRGYLATSMREIADEMNMKGGGSLYAHIRSKEDLLWKIASEAADDFFAALESTLAEPLTPDEKLRRAIVGHILVITEHLEAAAVYFDEWRHLTEPRRTAFLERRDRYERQFQGLFEAGVAAGLFRPLDVRLATLHILSAMNAIRHWYRPEGRLPKQEVASALADMLLNGLRRG